MPVDSLPQWGPEAGTSMCRLSPSWLLAIRVELLPHRAAARADKRPGSILLNPVTGASMPPSHPWLRCANAAIHDRRTELTETDCQKRTDRTPATPCRRPLRGGLACRHRLTAYGGLAGRALTSIVAKTARCVRPRSQPFRPAYASPSHTGLRTGCRTPLTSSVQQ
jgi:hypothetical protein